MARRVLVTGASGFVGSHALAGMLAAGWEAGVLARPDSQVPPRARGADVLRTDGSVGALTEAVGRFRPEAVVHIAGAFVGVHRPGDIDDLVGANIIFGTHLLEAMRACDCHHFVSTGTAWQHAASGGYEPVNLYAATKQAFEAIVDYYAAAHEMAAVTLYLADTYGPGDTRGKLLSLLARMVHAGGHLDMSPGRQRLDLTHVHDVARAYRVAVELALAAGPGHLRYRATGGAPIELRRVVSRIEQITGRTLDIAWGARPYGDRQVMEPWVGGTALPSWEPEIALDDGLGALIDEAKPAGP